MTQTQRWCVVALGLLLLVALPVTVRLLPVRGDTVSASDLLTRVQTSRQVAYSGDVESDGSLALPVADQFTDVADLLGGRTTMRVWWRAADDFRVDKLTTTGETDLFQDRLGTTTWSFEADRAVRTLNSRVRLPRTADLLPPALALRLLSGAGPDQVTRLGSERVAGIEAPGLRLTPRDTRSSIGHVDVWVDPASGLALRVSVFGRDQHVRRCLGGPAGGAVHHVRPTAGCRATLRERDRHRGGGEPLRAPGGTAQSGWDDQARLRRGSRRGVRRRADADRGDPPVAAGS
jgi:hypothetical protein